MKYFYSFLLLFFLLYLPASEIDNAINNKQFKEAEILLTKKLFHYPEDVDIRLKLAYVQAWQKKYKDAEFNFKKVMDFSPNYEDAYQGLANIYRWQNKNDDALFVLNDAYMRFGKPETALQIAKLYEQKEDYKNAKYYYAKANQSSTKTTIANTTKTTKKTSYTKNKKKNPWIVFSYYEYEFLDPDKGFNHWQYNLNRISYQSYKSEMGIHTEWFYRFNELNQNIGGIYSKDFKKLSLVAEYYYGFNASYIETHKAFLHSWWKITKKFIPTLSYKYSDYESINMHTITPGFEFYTNANVFGAKFNYLINEYNNDANSYVLFLLHYWNTKHSTYFSFTEGNEVYDSTTNPELFSRHFGIKHTWNFNSNLQFQFYSGFYDDEFDQKRYALGIGLKLNF